jgi:hypothetical protein
VFSIKPYIDKSLYRNIPKSVKLKNGIKRHRDKRILSESKQVSVKIYLSENLRARFKSACALQKVSMNQILLDFVEDWTTNNEKPKQLPDSGSAKSSDSGKGKGKGGNE